MKYNQIIVRAFFRQSGLPGCETEFKFHPERKWRFDFAWPDYNLALEVDGGIWISGGHNRGAQMLKTWEKENCAVTMGWRILRCQPKDLCLTETVEMVKLALRQSQHARAWLDAQQLTTRLPVPVALKTQT